MTSQVKGSSMKKPNSISKESWGKRFTHCLRCGNLYYNWWDKCLHSWWVFDE